MMNKLQISNDSGDLIIDNEVWMGKVLIIADDGKDVVTITTRKPDAKKIIKHLVELHGISIDELGL